MAFGLGFSVVLHACKNVFVQGGGGIKWSCSLRQALLCVHCTQCLSEKDMNPCYAAKVGPRSGSGQNKFGR